MLSSYISSERHGLRSLRAARRCRKSVPGAYKILVQTLRETRARASPDAGKQRAHGDLVNHISQTPPRPSGALGGRSRASPYSDCPPRCRRRIGKGHASPSTLRHRQSHLPPTSRFPFPCRSSLAATLTTRSPFMLPRSRPPMPTSPFPIPRSRFHAPHSTF